MEYKGISGLGEQLDIIHANDRGQAATSNSITMVCKPICRLILHDLNTQSTLSMFLHLRCALRQASQVKLFFTPPEDFPLGNP